MGNIRQLQIKNTAKRLLELYRDKFIEKDFNHIKRMVGELTENLGKGIRNKIAGYITKLISPRKKREDLVNYD
jgi:small subunit ribosomal protein S17e